MIPTKIITDYCQGQGWPEEKTNTFIAGVEWAERFEYELTHEELSEIAEKLYRSAVVGDAELGIDMTIDQPKGLSISISISGTAVWNDDKIITGSWINSYYITALSDDSDIYFVKWGYREETYIMSLLKALSK